MAGSLRFYWDTAPLVAWITDERRGDASEMSGLAEVVEMVERGQAILMTSVLWRAEVLDLGLTTVQKRRLESAFDGQTVIELGIDGQVMDLAGYIRGRTRKARRRRTRSRTCGRRTRSILRVQSTTGLLSSTPLTARGEERTSAAF